MGRINLFSRMPGLVPLGLAPIPGPDGLGERVLVGGLPLNTASLLVAGLTLAGWLAVAQRRRARRLAAAKVGLSRGLHPECAAILGRLCVRGGRRQAEAWLDDPDHLRRRLAGWLRAAPSLHAARERAAAAGRMLRELGQERPAFDGAPAAFDELLVMDATDLRGQGRHLFALAADEHSLTAVGLPAALVAASEHRRDPGAPAPEECPWPTQRTLLVSPHGAGVPFKAGLLLRPVPPRHEWVLDHDLVEVITNRRAAVRVACRLPVQLLPEEPDARRLRERLLLRGSLSLDELRHSPCWALRRSALLLDLSSGGGRLASDYELAPGTRVHVVLTGEDGGVAALPLAEVVDVRRGERGFQAGARFAGLRLDERRAVAECVRRLGAARAAQSSSSSVAAAPPPS